MKWLAGMDKKVALGVVLRSGGLKPGQPIGLAQI
jgi:hypothetical protein